PVIRGIWTSTIRHDVSRIFVRARKSSADENPSTLKPIDVIRPCKALRKSSSSSMIEIRVFAGKSASIPWKSSTEQQPQGRFAGERRRVLGVGITIPSDRTPPPKVKKAHHREASLGLRRLRAC